MPQNSTKNLVFPYLFTLLVSTTILCTILTLLLLTPSTIVYADWKEPTFISLEKKNTTFALLGDLNGDGALDYVAGNVSQIFGEPPQLSRIYLNKNDETGQFIQGDAIQGHAQAIGDMNGDGVLDIVAKDNDVILTHFNDGKGHIFRSATINDSHDTGEHIMLGDMDRNGTLDVVIVDFTSPGLIYFNNNDGTFTPGSETIRSKLANRMALGDINGDGALDIVLGKWFTKTMPVDTDLVYPHTTIYLNNGMGRVSTEITLTRTISKEILPTEGDIALRVDVKLGRIDSNNTLDVIATETNLGSEFYLNGGGSQGSFLPGISIPDSKELRGSALGDINNDGFLDMVSLSPSRKEIVVYLYDFPNENFVIETRLPVALPELFGGFVFSGNNSLALGDVNNDGSLDIVLGMSGLPQEGKTGQPDIVYMNNGGGGFGQGIFINHAPCNEHQNADGTVTVNCFTYKPGAMAVGDVDNNDFLDIIQSHVLDGETWGDVAVLLNSARTGCKEVFYPQNPLGSRSPEPEDITQVVLGDINNDNALDIVQANYDADSAEGYLIVYINSLDECGTFTDGVFVDNININQGTTSIALGDVNTDGNLDIIAGNNGHPSVVYLNQENNLGHFIRGTELSELNNVRSLAIGDVNSDGALDIVAGRFNRLITVYLNRNNGSGSFYKGVELSSTNLVQSIALGDLNSDGALDIATGNEGLPLTLYINNRKGIFDNLIIIPNSDSSDSVALGDINEDGFADIVASDPNNSYRIFLNDGESHFDVSSLPVPSEQFRFVKSMALGDLNRNGSLDIVLGRAVTDGSSSNPNTIVYLNFYKSGNLLPENPNQIDAERPVLTGNANFYSSPSIADRLVIPITYTLFDKESNSVGRVAAQYSLDGGNLWYTATPTITTLISNLATMPYPVGSQHIFNWDTFASGFFGQSDNVVLRFLAYSQDKAPALPGTYRYTDTVAGSYQWPYTGVTTFPFRARGTQIQVYTDTISSGHEVAGVFVYRLQKGQARNAILMGDEFGPFTTDRNGYLRGRGQLGRGDQLIAISPITSTEAYTVYYTNITPTVNGLTAFTVTVPGVQKLVVAPSRPLILFNLKVSLEWDARKDTTYLEQLRFDLLRSSELLFDLTNGQAALGDVTIYFNKEQWDTADIRIHATNDLRPHASVGGIVRKPRLERFNTGKGAHLYAPGHVEIGAVWNRYGNAGEKLSEDWARTLTHELGHYLFFLHDNYIGLENGRLIRVDGCPGMMGDPYTEADSEFHPDLNWLGSPCEKTFSHQVLGQSDWATIRHFYPWLNTPTVAIDDPKLSGPSLLPLAVTNILSAPLSSEAQTVDVPSFTIGKEDGSRYVASNNARAFLLQGNLLVNLGAPRLDRVQAWNARPDDQLCVYDLVAQSSPLTRCQRITTSGQEITLRPQPGWQPEVNVTLINSRTVEISVIVGNTQINRPLSARIYPQTPLADALPAIPLTLNPSTGAFVGSVTLTQPALEAYVHIFDNEMDPQYAALTEYTLGGAPTLQLSNGNTLQLSNGDTLVLSNGGTLVLSNGETRTLNPGDTLQLSNGGTLVFTEQGLTLVLSNGSTVIINNETLQLSNGGTLQLSNGDTLQLSNGGTLVLSNGNTLVVEEGETLMLSNGDAPIRSSDGQVVLFGEPTNTGPGEFYTLQVTTKLPMTLTYTTLVGQAYRLTASPGARKLSGASISFNYLGRDIDRDKEQLLKIYFWDGTQWERLPTTVDDYHNIAAAVVPNTKSGLGIYALMYSTEIPLTGPHWNIFAFVGPNKQLVADALASLNKNVYSIVWGYEPHPDPSDPRHWQAYDPTIPPTHKFYDWVNNLKSLTYGRGYWINISATQDITLYLKSRAGTVTTNAPTLETVGTTTSPPAVYYGEVWPTEDFTPLPGMTVTAWVDGQLCGQTQTRELQGTVAYVLYIPAIGDSEYPNCGAVGRKVTFKVNDVPMLLNVGWDNTTIRLAPLFNRWVNPFFLPIIVK